MVGDIVESAGGAPALAVSIVALVLAVVLVVKGRQERRASQGTKQGQPAAMQQQQQQQQQQAPTDVVPCIKARRSVFPRDYAVGAAPVARATMQRLLDAAMWAPYHGPVPPWRFVVLGREAMVDMQRRTLAFYDANWERVGKAASAEAYHEWRTRTEQEISGRWGPVTYMVAIIMRRQAGSKRMKEWEEAAATACAVQNMHIQACAESGLACYWSSWHSAMVESEDMRELLRLGPEDKCFGFFIVARASKDAQRRRDSRRRTTQGYVEWRD